MTIRLETVGAVKTLAGLVKSLIGAKQPRAVQERAQQELLRANPRLGAEGGLRPGITIVVPNLGTPLPELEDPAAPAPAPAPAAAAPAQTGLETVMGRVGNQLDASLATAKEQARTLRLKKTQDALLAAHPELTKDRLEAIAKQAEEEASHTAAVVEQFRRGLEDAVKRLPRR